MRVIVPHKSRVPKSPMKVQSPRSKNELSNSMVKTMLTWILIPKYEI
jgi:hypothetical protein